MAIIFINYKNVDKEAITPFVKIMEAAIHQDCCMSPDNEMTEELFTTQTCKEIDNCQVFLFMHSIAHQNINTEKDWAIKKLRYAQTKGKQVILMKVDKAKMNKFFSSIFKNLDTISIHNINHVQQLVQDIKNKQKPKNPYLVDKIQTVEYPDGSKYVGEMFLDQCHGHGTYTYSEGDEYVGEFKYDELDGYGIYTYANGDRYAGE